MNCLAAVSASATAGREAAAEGAAAAALCSSGERAVTAKAAVAVACGGGMRVGPLDCCGLGAGAPQFTPPICAGPAFPGPPTTLLALELCCCCSVEVDVVVVLVTLPLSAACPSGLA